MEASRDEPDVSRARRYAPWLWAALALFFLRVTGQLVVATWAPSFLPPMEEWYSGLVPYGPLLGIQIVLLIGLGSVCSQFSRGAGRAVRPHKRLGQGLWIFGWLYAGGMVVRYVVRMSLYPEARWFGGTIPIVFHWVLASFVLMVASYHREARA